MGLFRNCDPIKKTGTQGSLPGNVGIILVDVLMNRISLGSVSTIKKRKSGSSV